jgi:integrase
MSEAHSTAPAPSSKPAKPYPEFPLTAHPAGYWCKKIRGKLHYFGPWSDPDGALRKYLEQKDALHAGRQPRPDPEALTVKILCNAFLNHKAALRDAGELSPRTFADYNAATDLLVAELGKGRLVDDLRPSDFASLRQKMTKRWGTIRVRDFIQRIRSVFKFGYDSELMAAPMRFGPGFARPSKRAMRLERAKNGPRMFEAEEIRAMVQGALVVGKDGPELAQASVPLRAMILLGVNCGFGNADCGTLEFRHLDLERGWINFPRPKTGAQRRCPLWPETIDAIKEWLTLRPEPKDTANAGLVFVTAKGGSWHRVGYSERSKPIEDNPISKETRKLLDRLGINGKRNFYALRHTFETIGGEAKDQVAVDFIMGHAREDMASVYRERISDARLKGVSDFVRAWLFAEKQTATLAAEAPPAQE